MEPDDVIRQFEQLALDEGTELPIDDAIAGLAVLLADPAIQGEGEGAADGGGRDAVPAGDRCAGGGGTRFVMHTLRFRN
ncbi:hypothetical protein [Cupriavidus basilensis]|uniref:hypothetical protein n=1 Tax=Cupriavidus basilensis TaxID=68895 RepID=UPI001F476B8F|nr:hypothetical protein [Cupriavidus basilensis]